MLRAYTINSLLLILILTGGCVSNLGVAVERIEPDGDLLTEEVDLRKFEETVLIAVTALNTLPTFFKQATEWSAYQARQQNSPSLDVVYNDSKAQQLKEKGEKLLESFYSSYEDMRYQQARVASLSYVVEVVGFLNSTNVSLMAERKEVPNFAWPEEEKSIEVPKVQADIDRINNEISSLQKRVEAATGAASNFGGLVPLGVHRLNPGHPNYKAVLNGKPIGKPITKVSTCAMGDSTIMFVQENPAQFRVFSVDMNAETLVKGIVDISNKALQAAVKYSAPVPTPDPEPIAQ